MRQIINFNWFLFLLIGFASGAQNGDRFSTFAWANCSGETSEIGVSLKLDQKLLDRFRPIYLNYEREITAVNFGK